MSDNDDLDKRIKSAKQQYKVISTDPWGGEDLAKPYKQLINWLKELQQRRIQDEK